MTTRDDPPTASRPTRADAAPRGDHGRPGPQAAQSPAPRRVVSIVIAVLWTIPTFGLFVSSLRPEDEIKTTGWWTFFTNPQFTLENYQRGRSSAVGVLRAARQLLHQLAGDHRSRRCSSRSAFASLAAYALAWINFRGRDWIYIGDLRAADRAAADGAGAAAAVLLPGQLGDVTLLPAGTSSTSRSSSRCGSRTPASRCRSRVFLLHNFIVAAAEGPDGGGPGRRRQPPEDLPRGSCCR